MINYNCIANTAEDYYDTLRRLTTERKRESSGD